MTEIMSVNQKLFEFFKSKGNNSAENFSTQTKFALNRSCVFSWHIKIPNFNLKCQFVMEIMSRNWKLLEFLSPRGITLAKIIRPKQNSNSTYVFSWHIYVPLFNSKCQFVMEIIFLSPRGITLAKIIRPDPNSNSTCVFLWHIYVLNFISKCQFVMEIMSGNWKLL